MPLIEAISAVGQAIEVAKAMRSVEKNFDAATYKLQIAELMTALSDARMELVSAREAAAENDSKFEELKRTLTGQAQLVEAANGLKYKRNDGGKPAGFPICPTCEQRDGRLVYTVKDGHPRKVRCPVCDSRFDGVDIFTQTPVDLPETLADEQTRKSVEAHERARERIIGSRSRGF